MYFIFFNLFFSICSTECLFPISGVAATEVAYTLTIEVGQAVRELSSSGGVAAACSCTLHRPPSYGWATVDRSRGPLEARDAFLPLALRRAFDNFAKCGNDSSHAFGRKCHHGHHSDRGEEG